MIDENTMHLHVSLNAQDHLNINFSPEDKLKICMSNGGGTTLTRWGAITGDILEQTDLVQLFSIIDCGTSTEVT